MGLISKAIMLGGGFLVAKKLVEKNKKSKSSNNHRDLDHQDYYNQNQNMNQQYNYRDQKPSQQPMYHDQKDFAPAPVYREAQPQLQYGESARQMSPAVTGYGNEKARAGAVQSFK